jgi:hypothetical protein
MFSRVSPMTKAVMAFAALLIFGQILYGVLTYFVDVQSSAIGIILMMGAAMGAGQIFANSEKRIMQKGERARFAVFATITGVLIGIVGLYAVFAWYKVPFSLDTLLMSFGTAPGELSQMRGFLWIGAAVATVASLLVTYFASGFGAKAALKQLEKQGKL